MEINPFGNSIGQVPNSSSARQRVPAEIQQNHISGRPAATFETADFKVTLSAEGDARPREPEPPPLPREPEPPPRPPETTPTETPQTTLASPNALEAPIQTAALAEESQGGAAVRREAAIRALNQSFEQPGNTISIVV